MGSQIVTLVYFARQMQRAECVLTLWMVALTVQMVLTNQPAWNAWMVTILTTMVPAPAVKSMVVLRAVKVLHSMKKLVLLPLSLSVKNAWTDTSSLLIL